MMRACRRIQKSAIDVSLRDVSASVNLPTITVACLIACLVAISPAVAQEDPFEPPGLIPPPGAMAAFAQAGQPEWQFGFQLFHLLLEQKGMYSVSDFQESMDKRPTQTAVVLLGDLRKLPTNLHSRVERFLARGGVVLVASDETAFIRRLFLIRQGPFEVRSDEFAFQGFRDCPIVTDLRSGAPVLDGVNSLVANRCGQIAIMDDRLGNWQTLAQLPVVVGGGAGRRAETPLIAEFQSRYRRGGRLMLMADHSILINGMLWHGDNARLAVNLADWLSEGDRKEVVFVVDGEPLDAMLALPSTLPEDLPSLEELPTPTLEDLASLPKETLLKFANRFVAGMEDADVMNELLANQPAELETPLYRQMLYIAVGILAGFYTLRAMGRSGQRPAMPPPRAVGPGGMEGRVRRRSASELRCAGRDLAQNALRQLTGSAEPLDWRIPVQDVEIDAPFLRRTSVRSGLKKLKQLASSDGRTHTTQRDLRQLVKLIAGICVLQKEGRLRHPSIIA
jgi:hypothetical protein